MKKTLHKIIKHSLLGFTLAYIRLFLKNKKRFKAYVATLQGYSVHFNDPLSLYYEFIYIFKDEIYHFQSSKEKPFIIDGGACIGCSILYFKHLYPNAEILAFEPDKTVRALLDKNIKANALKDVRVVESGLADRDGVAQFDNDDTDGGKVSESGRQSINVTKLSNYIDKEVDFLKLNIEGAERAVFNDLDVSGKLALIDQLCFEWHSFIGQEQDLDEILEILKRNHFLYHISSLSTAAHGRFDAGSSNYYLMVYAKKIK